ncbi:lipoate-protein ligase A [Alkalibacillus flavidus]|uniref:Lipoate-protein ligase A n=1 Tax=Alkalibacillus flavidus TaxID=546021 RepID=A0ABV2KVF7_9BACI
MAEEWRLIDTRDYDAATNMALDECLLKWVNDNKIGPTIRFYAWSEPSLSIGQFQNVESSIDLSSLEKYDCQLVRRLTGGSAVLHDDELTYSIVVPENHPLISRSVQEAYYTLSKGLVKGFKLLGVQVDYSLPNQQKTNRRTDVCFERPAFYELLVDNKKLSGNAQVRKSGVLLQHGSIPMSLNAEMLFDLFQFPSDQIREQRRQSFGEKATTLNEVTGKSHTYDEVKQAFINGFQDSLNISLTPLTLSDEQWQDVFELAELKYRSNEWNYERTYKEALLND